MMKKLSYIFGMVSLVVLGYLSVVVLDAQLFQVREAQRLANSSLREPRVIPQPASEQGIATPYPATGSAFAKLVIPRLRMSTIVIEGSGEAELALCPGHIPGTPLPGNGGNVGVAGHRDTSFRSLRLIRKEDKIELRFKDRQYQYQVLSIEIVEPSDVRVLNPTGRDALTLVTCYPFSFVGAAPKRFIVHADCVNCEPDEY